ncbi:MAG: acetate kinase [Bacteroidales bacterium]|nr:acetate kinase [Bacteroidales bacterium]
MKILVLNCGSSSIKYQLLDMSGVLDMSGEPRVMAKGLLERIGLPMGEFTHRYGEQKHYEQRPIATHIEGIQLVMQTLTDRRLGVIDELGEIGAVGHRMAHGGEAFQESVRITPEVIATVRELMPLAPIHLSGNIAGVEAMQAVLPHVPQVAVFDNAFHHTLSPANYLYGLPYEYYERYGVRRFGFHGTSHLYVCQKGARMIGRDWRELKIISCHLGSGASVAAVAFGRSVDTSLGMTSQAGLMMGSRPGDVDPGAILYLMEKTGLSTEEMNNMLNKKCGLLGICGRQDMRDVYAGKLEGDERCTIAYDMFSMRVKRFIGAYIAEMGGCDLLVFTGGIGENAWHMRHSILENMESLGIEVDMALNDATQGCDAVLSTPSSPIATVVATTDEERVIATDTLRLVS